MEISIWFWVGFNAFVLGMLALDLGVFNRTAHEVSVREAATWSAVWVALSFLFAGGVWALWGTEPALQFVAGYLIEKSLSVDNIFVFVMLFSYFAVPAKYQHRVLFWGILGALVLRGVFIAAGSYALERFHWVTWIFGGLLVVTGLRMAMHDAAPDPGKSPLLRLARRVLPLSEKYDGQRFWTVESGRRLATPLFLVLLLVEASDILFALDSIPAIFAVTREPFLVYTANVLAILGLRSMYFLLAGVVDRFTYLKYGLAAVLVFVGARMTLADVWHIPVWASLIVIAVLIGGAIVASLRRSAAPGDSAARRLTSGADPLKGDGR